MTRQQQDAAKREFTMEADYRDYLAQFLHCAFERPDEYLVETPGPAFDFTQGGLNDLASAGLQLALCRRADSSCWTVEVQLTLEPEEINLAGCRELWTVYVLSPDEEAAVGSLEEFLVDVQVLFQEPAANSTNEDGLARQLRAADIASWTGANIKGLLTDGA